MHKWLQSRWLLVSDDIIPLKLLIKVGALNSSFRSSNRVKRGSTVSFLIYVLELIILV